MRTKTGKFISVLFFLLPLFTSGCGEDSVTPAVTNHDLLTKTSWKVYKVMDLSSAPGQSTDITQQFPFLYMTFGNDGKYASPSINGTWELGNQDKEIIFDKNSSGSFIAEILEIAVDILKIKVTILFGTTPVTCEVTFIPTIIIKPEEYFVNKIETAHFVFYYPVNDFVDTSAQEMFYRWLSNELKEKTDIKTTYYKYRNQNDMASITGKTVNAYADVSRNTIHSIWSNDNHEFVHIMFGLKVGITVPMFAEGVAVAYQAELINDKLIPRWNGQDFHTVSSSYIKSGIMSSADTLIETNSFRSIEDKISYPVSGSFVRFLIDNYGIEKFKQFTKLGTFTDKKEKVKQDFRNIYGKELNSAWSGWKNFLETYKGN